MRTGFAFLSCAFLTLTGASLITAGDKVSLAVCLIFFAFTALATPFIWTSSLALISRRAPPAFQSMMVGAHALSAFAGNLLVGWIGRFYEGMTPASFWLLHALLAVCGYLVLLLFQRPLVRSIAGRPDGAEDPSFMHVRPEHSL